MGIQPLQPSGEQDFAFDSHSGAIVTIRLTASGGSGHASGLFAPRHKRLLGAALREEVECRERVKRRPGVELSARLVAGGGLGSLGWLWDCDRGCAPGEARVLVLVEGCPRLREEE